MTSFFITGTDTGIGKTHVTVQLLRQLGARGQRVAGLKPVATGAQWRNEQLCNDDALQLQAASNVELPYAVINPFCFAPAVAPQMAAAREQRVIDTAVIVKTVEQARSISDLVLVEGVGGWLTPLSENTTLADLARVLHLPVILVVGLRLGCMNHALLTARAINQAGCRLHAWVANQLDPQYSETEATVSYLRRHLPSPCIGTVQHMNREDGSASKLDLDRFTNTLISY
ncbi:MAG: dethiobiotin synthase [Gammaproteobacteria bacterium]|nr:dethiobiotin synthase [Gammaproteobacteria bacterium]